MTPEKLWILGIDPSTRFVGWGLIDAMILAAPIYVASGVIEGKGGTLFGRYRSIRFQLGGILRKYEGISAVALEEGIIFKAPDDPMKRNRANPHTALKQAEVRGMVMGLAIELGVPFEVYMPASVKKAATGKGNAKKPYVQAFVARRFGLAYAKEDEADALAVALAHANRLEEERVKALPVDPMAGTFWASGKGREGEGE